jgi:hypothetical protein
MKKKNIVSIMAAILLSLLLITNPIAIEIRGEDAIASDQGIYSTTLSSSEVCCAEHASNLHIIDDEVRTQLVNSNSSFTPYLSDLLDILCDNRIVVTIERHAESYLYDDEIVAIIRAILDMVPENTVALDSFDLFISDEVHNYTEISSLYNNDTYGAFFMYPIFEFDYTSYDNGLSPLSWCWLFCTFSPHGVRTGIVEHNCPTSARCREIMDYVWRCKRCWRTESHFDGAPPLPLPRWTSYSCSNNCISNGHSPGGFSHIQNTITIWHADRCAAGLPCTSRSIVYVWFCSRRSMGCSGTGTNHMSPSWFFCWQF